MIGVIYIQDINNCPFLSKYIRTLDESGVEYKIIYWNRKVESGTSGFVKKGNAVEYRDAQDLTLSKLKKIRGFLKFRHFIKQEIRGCDKLVLLTTMSAVILFDNLWLYKGKYIFDYRDPSMEGNMLFSFLMRLIVNWSYFTCISSTAFKTILTKHDYLIAHNFRYEDLEMAKQMKTRFHEDNKIKLVYLGAIREYNHIRKQINLFANDDRFELYYYGTGNDSDLLEDYCNKHTFTNIHLMGPYNNDEKIKILKTADIINNHYPADCGYPLRSTNKIYDAIIYKIPLLSNINGIDARNSMSYGFGIGLALDSDKDKDNLYTWYMSLNKDELDHSCSAYLEEVLKDDNIYIEKIKSFINYD